MWKSTKWTSPASLDPKLLLQGDARHVRTAGMVVGVVVVLSLVTSMTDRRPSNDDPDGTAADVMKQALKWSDTAAQDNDVLMRWQHLSLAKAYLNVARHIASDVAIERASRTNVRALSRRVDEEMQATVSSLYRTCSKLRPSIQLPKSAALPGEAEGLQPRRVTWM